VRTEQSSCGNSQRDPTVYGGNSGRENEKDSGRLDTNPAPSAIFGIDEIIKLLLACSTSTSSQKILLFELSRVKETNHVILDDFLLPNGELRSDNAKIIAQSHF
jgi:hypothetical protein